MHPILLSNVQPVGSPELSAMFAGRLRKVYPATDLRDGQRVYFVQSLGSGKVKIGRSACVSKRISQIEGSSPEPIQLLFTIEGGQTVESEIHKLYAAQRAHREWFDKSGALARFIDGVTWSLGQMATAAARGGGLCLSKPKHPSLPFRGPLPSDCGGFAEGTSRSSWTCPRNSRSP